MVVTVQEWPEYHELLEIVREKVIDVDRIIELLRKLALKSPVLMVSIHCVYLDFVSCCLRYVHNPVLILVMNVLLLPTEHGGHCASLARIP
jgi:hypothetical protein